MSRPMIQCPLCRWRLGVGPGDGEGVLEAAGRFEAHLALNHRLIPADASDIANRWALLVLRGE